MLIALALVLAAPSAASSSVHPAAACAASGLAGMTPGDALQSLDDFRARLSARDRRRLDRALPRAADGGIARCAAGEGSRASCEVAAYLPALRRSGLMPRFVAGLCPAHRAAPGR